MPPSVSATSPSTGKKFWGIDPARLASVLATINAKDVVADVGAGGRPLARADVIIDWNLGNAKPDPRRATVNLSEDKWLFGRNHFDFIYCRHTLEDLWNPINCLREMGWAGKRGYIEVPSALVELTRGVDANDMPWRGYHHHRWIFWVEDRILNFVAKLPVVEYADLPEVDEYRHMLNEQRNWNLGYYWNCDVPWRHWEHEKDFWVSTESGRMTYEDLLRRALRAYIT